MKRTLCNVWWVLWFFWGLTIWIWAVTHFNELGIWLYVLSMVPIILWATFTWNWIDKKLTKPKQVMFKIASKGYWYDGYTGEKLEKIALQGVRSRQVIYDEWHSGDSSRDGAEDSEGAERESGVSFTWSADQPEVRPEDGKA